eukprot:7384798-Prymnesium_polylepis.1
MSYPAGSEARLVYCVEPCMSMRQWVYPRLSNKQGVVRSDRLARGATERRMPECSLDPHLEQVRLDPKCRLVGVVLELLPIAEEQCREIGQVLGAHNLRVVLVSKPKVVIVLEPGQEGGAQRDRAGLLKQKLGLPKHGWRRRRRLLRCDRGTERIDPSSRPVSR